MFVFFSAQSELLPYAEVVNGMLVQILNSSLGIGDKEQGQKRPLRFSLSYDMLPTAVATVTLFHLSLYD